MRYLTFNAAFLPTRRNIFKCHVFIFHTNCLPFGFLSPVTGRQEACLFQGCRLVTRSAGRLPVAVYVSIDFFWSYTSVYTSETKHPRMREFSIFHELLITFSEKSDSSQNDTHSQRHIVFFSFYVQN